MQAELIYDISHQEFNLLPLLAAAVVLLLALAAWWRQRRLKRPATVPPTVLGFFVVMAGVATLAIAVTLWDHQRLADRLQGGRVQVAQGQVQAYALQHTATYNTSTKRYDRATWERFQVNGTAFVYRLGGGDGAGFHNSTETPLPIVDGLLLRLHYVEDVDGDAYNRRILRLERLCATPCPSGQG